MVVIKPIENILGLKLEDAQKVCEGREAVYNKLEGVNIKSISFRGKKIFERE